MNEKPLKLNYKRTFIIGFAFFGILMLWQVYNTYCPSILTELFKKVFSTGDEKKVQYIVGVLMACDNIVALFMLPIFGMLSDKTKSRFGKRMPYIVIGTVISCIVFPFIVVMFLANSLVGVIIMITLTLLAMQMYRNPAVSLMPDVTPKPLRSKANGIINIVGYIGAILGGAMAMIFPFVKDRIDQPKLLIPFIITSVCMLVTCAFLFFKVKENKIELEIADDLKRGEQETELKDAVEEDKPLSRRNRVSLIILITALFLWFASFNAVETFWSNYGIYHLNISNYSLFTIVLTIASLISFLPASIISEKIGRKWTIVIGLALLVGALVGLIFIGKSPETFVKGDVTYNKANPILYVLFAIAGIGWAFVNCCSYPMVVELANKKNVGKYTGIYYAASMAAQSLTPVVAGLAVYFADAWNVLFIYSSIIMGLSLITFLFVNNVKTKKEKTKKGLEAFDQD